MSTQSSSRYSRTRSIHTFAAIMLLLALGLRPALAATVVLNNNRTITGTIDEAASDERQLVIKTNNKDAEAVVKIPRAKILRVEQEDASAAANAAGAPAEQSELTRAESALASDPTNAVLKKKVEELRKVVQSHERLNYSAFFDELDVLIQGQKFDEAVAKADGHIARISDENAKGQFKRLKAQAHIGLAHGFREHVNYVEEERNYRLAMEADPENVIAPLELADLICQVSPARNGEACVLYEKGIALAAKTTGIIPPAKLLDYEYKLGELYQSEKHYVASGDKFLQVMLKDTNFAHATADDMALAAYSKLPSADLDGTTRTHIITNVQQILAKKPSKQQGYLLLGRIFYDKKQWAEAARNLALAVKNDSGASPLVMQEALFNLSLSLRKLHQDEQAVEYLSRLLNLKQDHYDATCELAEILVGMGKFPDAQKLYEAAQHIDSDKARAYLGKGTSLQRQGNYDDARKSFQSVLDRDDKNAPAQLAIARSYFEQKKYEETITEAQKAVEMIRDHYKKEGEETGTKNGATSQTAVAEAPAGLAPLPMIPAMPTPAVAAAKTSATVAAAGKTSSTLAAAGKTSATVAAAMPAPGAAQPGASSDKAKADAELLAKITPEDRELMAEANTLIGKAYTLTKKTNQARDFFADALKFSPEYAAAYEGLGLNYAEDKLDNQAVESFQKAIAIDSDNPDYYLSFAAYWQGRKALDKALPLYLKYQELGGRDPQVSARIKECGGTPKTGQ